MSDIAFVRLMLVLLLLICGCLMLLDRQRQRELWNVRREIDNAHARMNAAGLLDEIGRDSRSTEELIKAYAHHAPGLWVVLNARSNDELDHLAKEGA